MQPLQDKKGQSVTAVFKHFLREGRRPTRLRSDIGREFRSQAFNALLSEQTSIIYLPRIPKLKSIMPSE